MWLPADVVYFVTLLGLVRRQLVELDLRIRPREAAEAHGADR
jgi:hypothetical protein